MKQDNNKELKALLLNKRRRVFTSAMEGHNDKEQEVIKDIAKSVVTMVLENALQGDYNLEMNVEDCINEDWGCYGDEMPSNINVHNVTKLAYELWDVVLGCLEWDWNGPMDASLEEMSK